MSTSHFDVVIDCGSGGTRPYPRGSPLPAKLPWTGPRTIVEALQCDTGRRAFAAAVGQLAEAEAAGGRLTPTILLGATAGLRYALEVTRQVTHAQIEGLSSLLPAHCSLRILSGLEEASCELRACRRYHADPSCAVISMGGRSMQIGREASLYSLPFAAHWGRAVLRDAPPDADWAALVASVSTSYERMCAEVQAAEHIAQIEGSVVGIVDVVDMARRAGIAERTLAVAELCEAMDAEVRKHSQQRGAENHLGQVLAFRAVVRQLLAPTCTVSFANFKVNWAEGWFLQQQEMESVGGIGASHPESQEAPPPSPAAAAAAAAVPAAAAATAALDSVTRHELKVLTLNCWFDDYEHDTRAEALRRLIIDSAADIVMLQEVVPKLARFLAAAPDIAERYVLSTATADADRSTSAGGCDPYGVLMLVFSELGALPTFAVSELPTRMHRTMLTARVQLNGEVFTAATVHLESSSSDTSAAESGSTRQKQLVVTTAVLGDACMGQQASGATVLAGDFNFCSRRAWSDAYTTASCGTHGRRPLENDVMQSPEILPGFRDVIRYD
jgi:endonuclease/exonuclease/phosphatase family metal-dependent hydrolase